VSLTFATSIEFETALLDAKGSEDVSRALQRHQQRRSTTFIWMSWSSNHGSR